MSCNFTIAFGPTAATVFSIVSLVSIAFKLVFFSLRFKIMEERGPSERQFKKRVSFFKLGFIFSTLI